MTMSCYKYWKIKKCLPFSIIKVWFLISQNLPTLSNSMLRVPGIFGNHNFKPLILENITQRHALLTRTPCCCRFGFAPSFFYFIYASTLCCLMHQRGWERAKMGVCTYRNKILRNKNINSKEERCTCTCKK